MNTQRHLFLDLENTIISEVTDGWHTASLINVDLIKQVISEFKPHYISVFSFAIWNEVEKQKFVQHAKQMIEDALSISFHVVLRVDEDIIPACSHVKKLLPSKVDFMEADDFWGKHEAFRLFVRHSFEKVWSTDSKSTEVMLLDDVVWNEEWCWPDIHVNGKICNILKMSGE